MNLKKWFYPNPSQATPKRIYLLLKEYAKIGSREFQISELQDTLKVPQSLKVYADFKRKVLLKSKADIDKFTDLKIHFIEKHTC